MDWETSSLLLSPFLVFWIAQGNIGLSFLLQRLICSYACESGVALAGCQASIFRHIKEEQPPMLSRPITCCMSNESRRHLPPHWSCPSDPTCSQAPLHPRWGTERELHVHEKLLCLRSSDIIIYIVQQNVCEGLEPMHSAHRGCLSGGDLRLYSRCLSSSRAR